MIQKENPKILLLASPNNPTGNGLTPKELDELLAEVPSQTVVLIDEAYASFVSTDTSYIKKLVNKYQNLMISRTLYKFYGFPGLRMGFGFMSKEDIAKYGHSTHLQLTYNTTMRTWESTSFCFHLLESGSNERLASEYLLRRNPIKLEFHLYHELHGTDNLNNNRSILNETKVRKLTWCDKGIIQN